MSLQAILDVPFIPAKRLLSDIKLYLFWVVFTLGNLIFPMVVHTIPQGGMIFLPLFFFTLVAAYSEGLLLGVLVAIASPLINHALTGMPMLVMLPSVLFKSIFIAVVASSVAHYLKKISLPAIIFMVVAMQVLGGLFDYVMTGNLERAIGSLKMGVPGMIIMAVGGYVLLRIIAKIRE